MKSKFHQIIMKPSFFTMEFWPQIYICFVIFFTLVNQISWKNKKLCARRSFHTGRIFLEPDFFRTGAKYFFRTGIPKFLLEPEMAKFPQVINMVKKIRTEFLIPVLGSKFRKYSHCDDHFAISLQKRSVFNEKLYLWSWTIFQKVIFGRKQGACGLCQQGPTLIFMIFIFILKQMLKKNNINDWWN